MHASRLWNCMAKFKLPNPINININNFVTIPWQQVPWWRALLEYELHDLKMPSSRRLAALQQLPASPDLVPHCVWHMLALRFCSCFFCSRGWLDDMLRSSRLRVEEKIEMTTVYIKQKNCFFNIQLKPWLSSTLAEQRRTWIAWFFGWCCWKFQRHLWVGKVEINAFWFRKFLSTCQAFIWIVIMVYYHDWPEVTEACMGFFP